MAISGVLGRGVPLFMKGRPFFNSSLRSGAQFVMWEKTWQDITYPPKIVFNIMDSNL